VSYLNQVIRRTKPMTRCQCAVMAVLNEQWATPDEIWKRRPVYVESKYGRVKGVCYGTINAILRGLVQQGYVEVRGGKRKQYRQAG
jgi:DNA-binding PadR family transcriptional regulator